MRWTILSISPYQAHIYIYGASCRTNGLRMDNIASLLSVNWLVMWHIELQWGDLWRVQINIVGRMKRTDVWNDEELKKEEEKADQEKIKQLDNSWEKKTGLHMCPLPFTGMIHWRFVTAGISPHYMGRAHQEKHPDHSLYCIKIEWSGNG